MLTLMCRAIPFSVRALKKIYLTGVDIVVKIKLKLWFIVAFCLYSYQQRVRVITLFLNIFSHCFCMLSEFVKVFERKVWRVQVPHLHNATRVLSSLSRCFQLSKDLDKDSFRYLWYCGKEQIECRLAWHWWNSTDLGLIYMFLTNQNAEIFVCILSFRKSPHKPNMESTSKYGFPPTWREKMAAFWAWASHPGLSFCAPGFSPYMGWEERRVQGLGKRAVRLLLRARQWWGDNSG